MPKESASGERPLPEALGTDIQVLPDISSLETSLPSAGAAQEVTIRILKPVTETTVFETLPAPFMAIFT
jgi:hypothetical protein